MKPHLRLLLGAGVTAAWAFGQSGHLDDLFLHGKVALEDGSPPGGTVAIERYCTDSYQETLIATTNRKGEYVWRTRVDPSPTRVCVLRAAMSGFISSDLDVSNLNAFSDPVLPTLTLVSRTNNPEASVFPEASAPGKAAGPWKLADNAIRTLNWAEAEQQLRAVVMTSPKFAQGWNVLGTVYSNERKDKEAREALKRAVELDPKLLPAYLMLGRLNIAAGDWDSAARSAAALIKGDTKHLYPEAWVQQAIARYQLKDIEGAETSVEEAIRLDKSRRVPRAEYVLGLILEAKQKYTTANEHMSMYLRLDPKAWDAEAVRARIRDLGKPESGEIGPALAAMEPNSGLAAVGEAWVPGGMHALAAVAHLGNGVTYRDFFSQYCRALVNEITAGRSQGYPQFVPLVRTYLASVSELVSLGERRSGGTTITLSLTGEKQRRDTERVLALLGWKVVQRNGAASVEPGDRPNDSLRQQIPPLFGVDEIGMQEALESGRTYQFEIPSENARLVDGEAWGWLLKNPYVPGGLAAVFANDPRFAKAYLGLAAMDPGPANAVVSAVGLTNVVALYSDALARYSEAFTLGKDGVDTPGGADAEPAWRKLAGVSPRNPQPFFRALLGQQQGRLAAFYFALSRADAAHQRFFTRTVPRAERFYAWYRDSDELRGGVERQIPGWRTELFEKLPLDDKGNLRFPGGRKAWTSSPAAGDDVLLDLKSLEALVPVSLLEQNRSAPLDEASATLLAQNYTAWRSLFPYFEQLPALGGEEFAALAAFSDATRKQPPAMQNIVLDEWNSLVELTSRGVTAGAVDKPEGARIFRRICEGLMGPDHAARALEMLREIAGSSTPLRQAVPENLLRLSGARRSDFDRVLKLLGMDDVPETDAPAVLSGFVYAATLDPDGLLVNEDNHLLRKHQFKGPSMFAPASLIASALPPGSYMSGGFMNFDQIARGLAYGGRPAPPLQAPNSPRAAPTPAGPELIADAGERSVPAEAFFRADSRLVEVYTSVTDSRGRYIDDLSAGQFGIIENQTPRKVVAFETRSSEVSVALLLDTTESMRDALPSLKNASLRLIGELRPGDSVAVYSFNKSVTELQTFTTNKGSAKRAVLRTQPLGETALYDALARVSRDLAGRPGKKVIVVFTDGDDNSSTLTADTAIRRAKAVGVPVFTIAQGDALRSPQYLKQLSDVSKATGGDAFAIRDPVEIGSVFQKVSDDLMHGYLLTFQASPANDNNWRAIEVVLSGSKGYKVRAREGYYPE